MSASAAFALLGERAVVVNVSGGDERRVQRRLLEVAQRARAWGDIEEAVPGWNNLTLFVDRAQSTGDAVLARLRAAWDTSVDRGVAHVAPARTLEIPVEYGGESGPDLAEVAATCGLSEREVAALHAAGEYEVYFLGFQPGFAYLGGLDRRLHVPRRARPRSAVPAGSVAIGGSHTGVYPRSSPGGWQIVGRTALTLFDPSGRPPALLAPGDRVRFVAR